MKNGLIILTIFFSGLAQSFENNFEKKPSYVLTGKLINGFDGLTPECGILAWATVLEFEVVDFSDSKYSMKNIPVIFTCPASIEKSQFQIGKTYELILTDENPAKFEWTMYESIKDILKKYRLDKNYWFVENKK